MTPLPDVICGNADGISDYVSRYASKDAADEAGEDSESDDEMSSVGSYASGEDEEPAGNMDEL